MEENKMTKLTIKNGPFKGEKCILIKKFRCNHIKNDGSYIDVACVKMLPSGTSLIIKASDLE